MVKQVKNLYMTIMAIRIYVYTYIRIYVSQLLRYDEIEFGGHLTKMVAISERSKIWSASNLQNSSLGMYNTCAKGCAKNAQFRHLSAPIRWTIPQPTNRKSSWITSVPSTSWFIVRCQISGAELIPNGIRSHRYRPNSLLKNINILDLPKHVLGI